MYAHGDSAVRMGGRRKCRLWWPNDLLSRTPLNSSFLFGWFFSSYDASFDVVVAFCCDEMESVTSGDRHFDLEDILRRINEMMPPLLQERVKFSLLGSYAADLSENGNLASYGNSKTNSARLTITQQLNAYISNRGIWSCGCPKHEKVVKQSRLVSSGNIWMKLLCRSSDTVDSTVQLIPYLDHLHLNNETVSNLDLHVISYEIPTSAGHHYYCLGIQTSSYQASPFTKPKWFVDLQQRGAQYDLNNVIQAVNSTNATQILFGRRQRDESGVLFLILLKFSSFMWKVFALSVASISTLIFVALQLAHTPFSWHFNMYVGVVVAKLLSNTLRSIHFRCCQFLHWPLFLQDRNVGDHLCIELAEKAEFHKHSVWLNLVVDLLLGNLFGIALWVMSEPVCLSVSNFAHDFTNNWLRAGCVWLMGNPAGFKLNAELAGVIGIISLNIIQIWSTLWAFMAFLIIPLTKGLALCGILFGLTSAAALVLDAISLLTMHVTTLRLGLSLMYSTQIKAVAGLWRLFRHSDFQVSLCPFFCLSGIYTFFLHVSYAIKFQYLLGIFLLLVINLGGCSGYRGQKWNPLRLRLDSYDYTVEQHVVGSLLFTPILLLLPTTSAFYIFFTILCTTLTFIDLVVEATISVIHCTPYGKMFLWLKRKQRFPSGLWFEVIPSQYSDNSSGSRRNSSLGRFQKTASDSSSSKPTVLVTFLRSNFLSFRQVVLPHYSDFSSAYSKSFIISVAYGLLTGRRCHKTPGPIFPMELQWMVIPWKEYWQLCYDSVYACRSNSC